MSIFHGVHVDELLKIKGKRGHGVSIAIAQGDEVETYCAGSGRFAQDFPVNPDMLFQAGSVSKPMFALTLLRYVDKGLIDLDGDISSVLSDIVDIPLQSPDGIVNRHPAPAGSKMGMIVRSEKYVGNGVGFAGCAKKASHSHPP